VLEFRPEFEIKGLEYKEIVVESPLRFNLSFEPPRLVALRFGLCFLEVSCNQSQVSIVLPVIYSLCLQFHRQIRKSTLGQSIFRSDNSQRFPRGSETDFLTSLFLHVAI